MAQRFVQETQNLFCQLVVKLFWLTSPDIQLLGTQVLSFEYLQDTYVELLPSQHSSRRTSRRLDDIFFSDVVLYNTVRASANPCTICSNSNQINPPRAMTKEYNIFSIWVTVSNLVAPSFVEIVSQSNKQIYCMESESDSNIDGKRIEELQEVLTQYPAVRLAPFPFSCLNGSD